MNGVTAEHGDVGFFGTRLNGQMMSYSFNAVAGNGYLQVDMTRPGTGSNGVNYQDAAGDWVVGINWGYGNGPTYGPTVRDVVESGSSYRGGNLFWLRRDLRRGSRRSTSASMTRMI
jgi:hypothetical protein